MILEEYCSYILSRERYLEEFTIPGSNVKIDKNELLTNMRLTLRDNGDRYFDYDSLLLNTLMSNVSKDYLGKNKKFDINMDAILSNIRIRVERINSFCKSTERPVPFSYERVFEILVYYLRLITNILKSDKEQTVHYVTAEISPDAIIYMLNRKLTMGCLDAEWEEKKWKAFIKDYRPSYSFKVDNYLKFLLLSTYIRYCEIKGL